ncbi:DsbA family oxidoreductase [Rhodococcus sp. HNM0569]|uniref:DsbA family oxidoreductase n=1 Tax=Rhodococcus sp. HNM0569 TaxID=2716340 RepID=UPI003211E85A
MNHDAPTSASDIDRDITVDVFSDIACPWCYIGKHRFAAALRSFDGRDRVRVRWHAYQLDPTAPVGAGRREIDALVEMKGMSEEQVRQMFAQVVRNAQSVGLELDFDRAIAANTFDAHRLVQLAGDRADGVVDALFRAHFVEGRAVDDRDVLVDIAASEGLDADDVKSRLDAGEGADEVRDDLAAARQLQITGVPFFIANGRLAVSGAQPEDVFVQLLSQAETHD